MATELKACPTDRQIFNALALIINRLLLDLKNRPRDEVLFLRDSVCDPYREMMIDADQGA